MFLIVKALILAGVAVVAGYLLSDIYEVIKQPEPVILEHGSVVSKSQYSDKLAVRAKRKVARGNLTYWEVETPGGAWLDCAGDCVETYRREVLDFWESQAEDGTGRGGN